MLDGYPTLILISAALAAVLAFAYQAAWKRDFEKARGRRQRARAGIGQPDELDVAGYFVIHDLPAKDASRILWREFRDRWLLWRRVRPDEALNRSRGDSDVTYVGEETVRLLKKLLLPWPHDALLLGGALNFPQPGGPWSDLWDRVSRYNAKRRPQLPRKKLKEIAQRGVTHPLVVDASRRLTRIMESAGFFPLVHSHVHGSADSIFRAKGIEAADYGMHPHKLFFRAATVMPHLPFSHTLFGEIADRHAGSVAPDVVAFILFDHNIKRRKLSPRLYWLDKLVPELGKDTVSLLRQKDFQIIPDPSINDSKHGAIDAIELFGFADKEKQFMRFDYERVEPASSTSNTGPARRAIWALRQVLNKKSGPFLQYTDMVAGDILLVNNWRVATVWDDECDVNQWYESAQHVHDGDRLVFQMNFYHQGERVEHAGDHGASDHH